MHLCFYDELLLVILRQCQPEASSLSCKGFISHVSMERVQNPISLVLIIIIPPMFLNVLLSLTTCSIVLRPATQALYQPLSPPPGLIGLTAHDSVTSFLY